jgi:hypothetical protein
MMRERGANLETKSKLDTKSTRKTRYVWISCGCLHARRVRLFNKTGVETPRGLLNRVFDIRRVWIGSALMLQEFLLEDREHYFLQ